MAFNWDKLCKAQREHTKPKYALDAISKLLKKRPTDPYVLTWKTSVLLLLHDRTNEVITTLQSLVQRQPPITDLPLLALIYRNFIEATNQLSKSLTPLSSVGGEGLKAWQNAAKVLPNRRAKLNLWSELLTNAMKQECWEDVRFAILQVRKEGPNTQSEKASYYYLILSNQLSGEQKNEVSKESGKPDMSSQIQFTLALRQIKDAYDSSPKQMDETIRVSSMSDLRFMAAIYKRQGRVTELFELWKKPPPHVRKVMDSHHWDYTLLALEVAFKQKAWKQLEEQCMVMINRIIEPAPESQNATEGGSEPVDPVLRTETMNEVCTISWVVWSHLLESTTQLYQEPEAKKRIEDLRSRIFPMKLSDMDSATPRAVRLTHLTLTSYIGEPVLDAIKDYYLHNFSMSSCFQDLRRFVARLPLNEHRNFQLFINDHARTLRPNSENIPKGEVQKWIYTEEKVLAFELLLLVSQVQIPDLELLEVFVCNALKLCCVRKDTEGALDDSICLVLAVQALLHLFEATDSIEYLYQATVLTRHALSLELDSKSRPLALLASRLHLALGFGNVAFELYNHAKIKEMLHDTVSWVLLFRISQTHPFGSKGHRGFSADVEAEKTINAIRRMEDKTNDLLYAGVQGFCFDKTLELLELKHKLRWSLTKQVCLIERRRMARLRGAAIDRSLDLPFNGAIHVSDNCDWDALPTMIHTPKTWGKRSVIWSRPAKRQLYDNQIQYDTVAGLVFKDITPSRLGKAKTAYFSQPNQEDDASGSPHRKGDFKNNLWDPISAIVARAFECPLPGTTFESSTFEKLLRDVRELHIKPLQNSPAVNELKYNRPQLDEEELIYLHGLLEIACVLTRLTDQLRSVTKQRSHPFQSEVTTSICSELQSAAKDLYEAVRVRANFTIRRLKATGLVSMKTMIRWGKTGVAVATLISDDDLNYYGSDYVDSAIEATEGLLKVQMN